MREIRNYYGRGNDYERRNRYEWRKRRMVGFSEILWRKGWYLRDYFFREKEKENEFKEEYGIYYKRMNMDEGRVYGLNKDLILEYEDKIWERIIRGYVGSKIKRRERDERNRKNEERNYYVEIDNVMDRGSRINRNWDFDDEIIEGRRNWDF